MSKNVGAIYPTKFGNMWFFDFIEYFAGQTVHAVRRLLAALAISISCAVVSQIVQSISSED